MTLSKRYEYASIVRATLSQYELVLLFYNCLSSNGKEKFKPLIERYAIFNNLRVELLAEPSEQKLYASKFLDDYAFSQDEDENKDMSNEYKKEHSYLIKTEKIMEEHITKTLIESPYPFWLTILLFSVISGGIQLIISF